MAHILKGYSLCSLQSPCPDTVHRSEENSLLRCISRGQWVNTRYCEFHKSVCRCMVSDESKANERFANNSPFHAYTVCIAYIHKRVHIITFTHATHIHIHTYTSARTHVYTHTPTYAHTNTYTKTHAHMRVLKHSYAHIHTRICAYLDARTQTYKCA